MLHTIKSVKHTIIFDNGIAEESMQEFDNGVRIRIYGSDKAILLSQNYNLDFNSAPVKIYFEKYIKEYGLSKINDDYVNVHVKCNNHDYYFTIKKANELTSQFTYRMDDGYIYRSKAYPVKYEDMDNLLAICTSIAYNTYL